MITSIVQVAIANCTYGIDSVGGYMCCSLTYKQGKAIVEIQGFNSVREAVKHTEDNCIDNYFLKVEAD